MKRKKAFECDLYIKHSILSATLARSLPRYTIRRMINIHLAV